ncbi:MAG: restriction endonuclease [Gemmatimonadetes bacterium]|nr:restriction endonuclease [Gemmatimonadota bacterium]
MIFEDERVPIWSHKKGIFKPAILGQNGAALSVQTSWESPYDDAFDESSGVMRYHYQRSDPNGADNRNLRAAFQRAVPIVYFVAEYSGLYTAHLPTYVTGDDTAARTFTLMKDATDAIGETGASAEVVVARRAYATRTVLQRLHQRDFRRVVLAAYQNRCAICRLRHARLLDAAHILSDRHPRGEAIVTNGLGLCKIHHSAYDADILGIDPDARVHIREDVLREEDGPMLLHGLQEIAGSLLSLPRRPERRPNPDFLAERFDRFSAA